MASNLNDLFRFFLPSRLVFSSTKHPFHRISSWRTRYRDRTIEQMLASCVTSTSRKRYRKVSNAKAANNKSSALISPRRVDDSRRKLSSRIARAEFLLVSERNVSAAHLLSIVRMLIDLSSLNRRGVPTLLWNVASHRFFSAVRHTQ